MTATEGARSAETLGRERSGTGVVIGPDGLVLTIGYLMLEADTIQVVTQDGRELAYVDLPGALGDGFVTNFGVSGEEFGGWSILGLLQLNTLGTLTVTISSIMGDFNLTGSTLTATGLANVASVPEPGALGLLGIGLMGMAFSMRRRKHV